MKNVIAKCFFSLPAGMRWFVLIYSLSCPLFWIERAAFGSTTIAASLALTPTLVWKGEVWRLLTYALTTDGVVPWVINLFWFFTLLPVLARDWSSKTFWFFCLVTTFVGALPIILLWPGGGFQLFSAGAVVFGILVAWAWLYGRERIALLGIGEVSVRQAAMFIAVINAVITFFSCGGLLLTLSLMCGALGGWLYLALGKKRVLSRSSQPVESERIARLEL